MKPEKTLCIVDAIFGFSFKPPMREPFKGIVEELCKVQNIIPIVSVDVPTGWDVDKGPISQPSINPAVLVSLTVPKPCSSHIRENQTTHYVGEDSFLEISPINSALSHLDMNPQTKY